MKSVSDPSHYFYARNGEVLKNLLELSTFLHNADDDSFDYHFNEEKNDFATWVGDTMKKKALSNRMYRAKTREQMCEFVDKEIEREQKKPAKPKKPMTKNDIISKIKEAMLVNA